MPLTPSEIAEHLSAVPLFDPLDAEELATLAGLCRQEVFDTGDVFVRVGEPGQGLHIVLDGTIQVVYPTEGDDYELARLEKGQVLGEMALLNDRARTATARAISPVQTLSLPKWEFRRFLEDSPRCAVKLLAAISGRMPGAEDPAPGSGAEILRDPRTGLPNRKAFHERLGEEADRAKRYGGGFALILLHVDPLDGINDAFGQAAGDAILAWLGGILVEHTRSADACFRISGGGFAILAPATPEGGAHTLVDRLVGIISEARPPMEAPISLAAAAGFAMSSEEDHESHAVLTKAEEALDLALNEGPGIRLRPRK